MLLEFRAKLAYRVTVSKSQQSMLYSAGVCLGTEL